MGLDLLVMGSVMVEITPATEGQSLGEAEALVPLPSGAATNFAVAAQKLGVQVGLISRVGDDEWGQWLHARIGRLGINIDRVLAVEQQYSPVSFCWMDRHGAKTFYFYRFPGYSDPLGTLTENAIEPGLFSSVRCFDFTEAAIRREPLRSAAFKAARLAREQGCLVIYAVNYRPAPWAGREGEMLQAQRQACSLADVVVMNETEATMLTGFRDHLRAAAEVASYGPTVVAVTGGDQGAWLWHRGQTGHVPAFEVPVLYDIGAGDAFHAGLAVALLRNHEGADAVRLASAVAALKISRSASTDYLPTWEEACKLAGLS